MIVSLAGDTAPMPTAPRSAAGPEGIRRRFRPRRGTAAWAAVGGAVALLLAGCAAPEGAPRQGDSNGSSPRAEAGLAQTTIRVPDSLDRAPFDSERTVTAPKGWTVALWARVDGARLAAWTPDGRLLVSRPESGDVQVLTPHRDPTRPPAIDTLVSGLTQPHGLAFDGDSLLVAESDRIDAFDYADGAVTKRRTVLAGLPNASTSELRGAYAHALKSVVVGDDGALYVSVGSTGNVSPEDRTASPERASILRVEDGRATAYAHGVRNGTGLAVAPDGAVWTAVNNRDRVAIPTGDRKGDVDQSYVNDHPLEPVAKLFPGRDLGWPYCNPDPDVRQGQAGTPLDYSDRPFLRDVETNADGAKLDCAALPRIEQGLPAHSAPLGMTFAPAAAMPSGWGAGALVGVHGSWNRQPPEAPRVAFLPYADGALGEARTLLGGFQLADGSRWGRAVAAVAGPDGAVYVTDDAAGAVYRLSRT